MRVGVLGATGAVGSTILEVLAERDFPAAEAAFPDLVDRIEFVEVGVELQHANGVMQ